MRGVSSIFRRWRRRRWRRGSFGGRALWRSALGGLCVAALGCGPIRYVGGVTGDASEAVEQARAANAAELAPYWWTRAVEYLARARYEAAASDWQAANRFGQLAQEAATTAAKEAAAAEADPSLRPMTEPAVAPAKDRAPAKERAPATESAPAKESALPPTRPAAPGAQAALGRAS